MESKLEEIQKPKKDYTVAVGIAIAGLLIAGSWIYSAGLKNTPRPGAGQKAEGFSAESVEVAPEAGVELPVKWGSLGKDLVASGVVAKDKFEALYEGRGGLSDNDRKLLEGNSDGNLVINRENAGLILNLFWALGLGNKNDILEKGEMADPKYGGAGRFASTGGWTISSGGAMEHYSRHQFVNLTKEQQDLVDRVSRNIYRPCCGNSTHFPDCNHGMAMLGLLELMAAQGVGEEEMYKAALVVNSYWFEENYKVIAQFLKSKGVNWNEADPKEILGYNFSSIAGFENITRQLEPQELQGGGGCGV